MSSNISGFGIRINIKASETFPQGINITQTADDADPFDAPDMQITEGAMGGNGDLITWNVANPIIANIAVIPNGEDDQNLAILFEANRAGRGKTPARDVITMTVVYPDGRSVTATQGAITNGVPMSSIASSGRTKSKVYGLIFENMSITNG